MAAVGLSASSGMARNSSQALTLGALTPSRGRPSMAVVKRRREGRGRGQRRAHIAWPAARPRLRWVPPPFGSVRPIDGQRQRTAADCSGLQPDCRMRGARGGAGAVGAHAQPDVPERLRLCTRHRRRAGGDADAPRRAGGLSPDPDPKPWWADWADTAGPAQGGLAECAAGQGRGAPRRGAGCGGALRRRAARHGALRGVMAPCAQW